MIQSATVLTIVLMAASTYVTRALGYVLLRGRTFSPRVQAVLEAVPGCVLIAVIAPAFVSDRPADLIALALTVLAAMRWPVFPTVVIGVVSAGLLRYLLG